MRLWEKQQGLCHYCGILMVRTKNLHADSVTVDHIIPESEGGTRAVDNVVGACWTCNNARGNTPYLLFVALVAAKGRPHTPTKLERKLKRKEAKRAELAKAPARSSASHMSANRPYLAGIAKYPTLAEALAEAGAVPEELNEQLLAARERWGS